MGKPLKKLTYTSSINLQILRVVIVPFRNAHCKAVVLERCHGESFKTRSIVDITDDFFSLEQFNFAQFISKYYACSFGEALALFVPFKKSESKFSSSNQIDTANALSIQQQNAYIFIKKHRTVLLFGDTGSGKTEIYVHLFRDTLKMQQRALMLMPEISLTPQMQKRLGTYFGEHVVMWHSKLTKKQRENNLQKILDGSARVIAGARSALFLPINDLGLIVVDEEHDDSYKASSRPRYHARDMAVYYGKMLDIPVVLGSATPSLTSFAKYPYFRLKGGHFDSKRTFEFESSVESVTPLVENAIMEAAGQQNQAMMFVPTRANFKYLICNECGHTYQCPFCSVGMSLHRYARQVRCHYCGYSEYIPERCPKCQHGELVSTRLGTAEAVDYFTDKHPAIRTAQFDRDTITTQKKLIETLKRFNDGEIDVLIGTQMLSKGHDYHNVTLAVIMGLDNILGLSDYRARERALSMLVQIAGRSGRRHSSRVIVQTFNEVFFNYYIDRYELFLEDEKRYREGLYPPYKKLCRVLFAHKNSNKAQLAMEAMRDAINALDMVEIVGSGKSPIEKIANKYRFQILLRADKSTDLIRVIKHTRHPLAEIDMDPIEFG